MTGGGRVSSITGGRIHSPGTPGKATLIGMLDGAVVWVSAGACCSEPLDGLGPGGMDCAVVWASAGACRSELLDGLGPGGMDGAVVWASAGACCPELLDGLGPGGMDGAVVRASAGACCQERRPRRPWRDQAAAGRGRQQLCVHRLLSPPWQARARRAEVACHEGWSWTRRRRRVGPGTEGCVSARVVKLE